MTKIGLNRSSAVVSLRSVVLGSLLIPLNNYFIMWKHLRYWSTLPTTISLIYNVVTTVVVLVILNVVIRTIAPEFVFQRGELLTIYTMLSIGSVLAGHDMIQTIMPTISDGFWFSTPENEWKKLFGHHLPVWPLSSSLARHKRYFSFICVLFWRKYILDFPSSFYLVPPNNVLGGPIDYFDRNYDLSFGFVEQTVDSK